MQHARWPGQVLEPCLARVLLAPQLDRLVTPVHPVLAADRLDLALAGGEWAEAAAQGLGRPLLGHRFRCRLREDDDIRCGVGRRRRRAWGGRHRKGPEIDAAEGDQSLGRTIGIGTQQVTAGLQ
jgi:hypothetical protein